MAEKNGFAGGIAKPRLFWPVVTLLPLFLLNVAFTNNFLHFEVKNGCLSGIIVDILNRSTYIMIIALGLSLVINFQGTLSSWWTKIFIGVLIFLFIFIFIQTVISGSGRGDRDRKRKKAGAESGGLR